MKLNTITTWLLSATFAIAATGCSRSSNNTGTKLAGEATFDAVPADQESIESQLKRFKGQTKFLTPSERYWGRNFAASRSKDAAGSESRAVQESDIFKIGKPGTKLLYLLNNYRGLQVVDFTKGEDDPQLLGRVEATGNWAQDMYFDADHDRLIVLENNYQSDEGDYYDYSDIQSRLVVYDVTKADAPKITMTLNLKGQLAESRMVGSVLYVATNVRPDYNHRQTDENGNGFVYSFGLDTAEVAQIDNATLAAPVAYGEKMNIIEVKKGDSFKYYLIAVLSKEGWGWWDRQSLVQVIDISSTEGKIAPLMVVSAKGAVRERSQTSIKNDTLIAVSNYQSSSDTNIQRIAVETFKFPSQNSEIIDTTEAQFRKLFIERELAKKEKELVNAGISGDQLQDQLDAYREVLTARADTGLQDRFIKQVGDDGIVALVKPLADSTVTVGDTHGLSASLQDVRFNGNLLYAFWVPTNNIDPLDIFDISEPQTAVKHLSHLEFDGWIQRAIPMSYNGKEYVLGLGWIIPSVDNEHQRRYPQAVLFEIKKFGSGTVRADLVAQKNLGTSDTWVNFNVDDKMIETRFVTDSSGVIMYTFSTWNQNSYLQGGKLVGFDLGKADTDPEQVFAEGGILSGSDSWLRRVFTNPEINRINTFADEALATYALTSGIGAANQIVQATNVLELARNVRAYDTLNKEGKILGVQFVSDYSWSYDSSTKTELRLVDQSKADAEKAQTMSIASLPGTYVDSLKVSDESFLVLTEKFTRVLTADAIRFDYKTEYLITRVSLTNPTTLKVTGQVTWEYTPDSADSRFGYQRNLLLLADGRVLAAIDSSLNELTLSTESIAIAPVMMSNCNISTDVNAQLKLLSGQLFLSYSEQVKDPMRANVQYNRNFVVPASLSAQTLSCQTAINLPGSLLALENGHIVTEDTRLIDLVKRGDDEYHYYDQITENALASLQLNDASAKLKALYDPKNVAPGSMKLVSGNSFIFVESTAQSAYAFFDLNARGDFLRPYPGMQRTENRLVQLSFDDDLDFTKLSYVLTLPLNVNANLQAIFTSPDATEGYLVVIGQGQRLSVVSFDGANRPVPKKIAKVQADFSIGEPVDSVSVNSFWYWYRSNIHMTPENRTLEIPQGMFGLTQLVIAK